MAAISFEGSGTKKCSGITISIRLSAQPRISAHPEGRLGKVNKRPASNMRPTLPSHSQKALLKRSQSQISALRPSPPPSRKKEKNINKVHKRNMGIDYYGISLMALYF